MQPREIHECDTHEHHGDCPTTTSTNETLTNTTPRDEPGHVHDPHECDGHEHHVHEHAEQAH